MLHFHPLQVKKIVKETDDCVSIEFFVPEALQDTFRFRQGQNLTLRTVLNGEELRRNYSICSAPYENRLVVAVKKVDGGRFSTFANEQLQEGALIDVLPPTGTFFTALHPGQKKNYLAFAAGSGITPILSIIKASLQTEPGSTFTLVYGNRNKNSIIFKEDLEAVKDKYLDRFRLYHVLSRETTDVPLNSGRVDAEKLDLFCNKIIDLNRCDEIFLCGPEEMVFCIKDFLQSRNVPASKIHFELFTVPGQRQAVTKEDDPVPYVTGEKAVVSVKLDGILFEFDLAYEGSSILDAALKQGADLPYACKGGVCTTCKAKLTEGKVEMDVNWGLEPDEVEKGFILTCQSHPRTASVGVDFDAR